MFFWRSHFNEANFNFANFEQSYIYETNLLRAQLNFCNFSKARFYKSNFQNTSLRQSSFEATTISNTIFLFTDIKGANLEKARFAMNFPSDIVFNLATADLTTRFPKGFATKKAGIILLKKVRSKRNKLPRKLFF